MLKKFTLLLLVLFAGLLAVEFAFTNSGGPPSGYTGAPGESTCLSCHGGSNLNPANAIRTLVFNGNASLTSYVPGTTYTVVYTVTNPSTAVFGFQMVAKNTAGNNVGTFIVTSPTQTQLVSGYLQHTFSGSQANPAGSKSWSFSWTAPATGTGTVSFYVATNVANGNGSDSGDEIYTNVFTLTEGAAAASIASPTLPASAYCVGATLQINFNATGTFGTGNVFTAQLSDAAGSFASPSTIGSLNSLTPAPISVNIPTSAAAGTGYKIRVVASTPATTGAESLPFTVSIPAATPVLSFNGFSLASTGSGPFVWFRNGNPISGATASTYIPTQTGTYMVGIENNGCSPSMSSAFAVNALITALQQPTTPAVCEGSTLFRGFNTEGTFDANNEFTLLLIDAGGVETTLPTTTPSSSSLVAVLPAGVSGFGYRYRLRSSNPLALSAISDTFNIVASPPAATITQNGLVLSSSVSTGNLWYKDGQAISGADQPTYTVTENGSYTVRYVASNCQSPPSNSIVFTNVSVAENQPNALRIYPNPAHDLLQVTVPDRGQLQLRDLTGKILLETSLEAGEHSLELHALTAGVYVLVWIDARVNSLHRFVKQ